jgi:hypothetical protein
MQPNLNLLDFVEDIGKYAATVCELSKSDLYIQVLLICEGEVSWN